MQITKRPRIDNARGYSLPEAMIASVVLALCVVSVAGVLSASHQQSQYLSHESQAISLGRELIEDIAATPFNDPDDAASRDRGPDNPAEAAGRSHFDNLDDFHAYTDTSDEIESLSGATVDASAGLGGTFTRTATVSYREVPAGPTTDDGQYALVTVTVTTPGGRDVTFHHLATAYSLLND
jgi:Tfp pilus assembly protein PilV